VQVLADQQAVHDVIMRYTRGIDRRDFQLVRSCYHNGAIDDHGSYRGGVDGFIEHISRSLPRFQSTNHFIGNQLIDIDGDVAHSESYCVAYHREPPSDDAPARDMVIGLRYVDRLERRSGEWRIAHRVCAMDWSRVDPVTSEWPFGPGTTRGRPYPDDVVYR
jgi:hypothetical protein